MDKPDLKPRGLRKPVIKILPRPDKPTRQLNPNHILDLAESISKIGLVQPVAIDREDHLLAGEHRLEAWKLLLLDTPEKRQEHIKALLSATDKKLKDNEHLGEAMNRASKLDHASFRMMYQDPKIPVLMLPINAKTEKEKAFNIEVTENEKREDYTKNEILSLANTLESKGYVRYKTNQKKDADRPDIVKALSLISGKSARAIQRNLSSTDKLSIEEKMEKDFKSFYKRIEAFTSTYPDEAFSKHLKKAAFELDKFISDDMT